MAPPGRKPQAVLFACGLNSVRSPMAMGLFRQLVGSATYVASAGVRKDALDPFAVAAMEEIGVDIGKHRPMTFEELDEWEGLNFDLLSDQDKVLASSLGAWGEKKMYGRTMEGLIRSTFVIGPDGKVEKAYRNVKATGHVARVKEDLLGST